MMDPTLPISTVNVDLLASGVDADAVNPDRSQFLRQG